MLAKLERRTAHVNESGVLVSGLDLSNPRPWLDNLTKPWWLVNDINADYWIVKDKSQAKFRKIEWDEILYTPVEETVSRLTDPENAGLLEVAQLFCYLIRESDDSHIDGTSAQCQLTNNLINIIVWMRLNRIYHFSQIRNYHFKRFAQKAPWGWPELHDIYARFEMYIAELKSKGEDPPVILKGKNKIGGKTYVYVDLAEISQRIGYDLTNFRGQNLNSLKWTHRFWTHMQSFGIAPPSNRRKEKEALLSQDEPLSCPILVGSLQKYFQTWTHLYNLRHKFTNDSLQHNPTNGQNPIQFAKNILQNADISSEDGRTESIPALQAAFLIDRSIRWVLNYADDLLDLRDKYSQYYEEANKAVETRGLKHPRERASRKFDKYFNSFHPKGFSATDPAAPWPLDPHLRGGHFSKNLSLGKAVNTFLAIACAIVIAAFTGRRAEEIMTIRDNFPNAFDASPPAIEIDSEGNTWIWCWIEKTVQAWEKRPCPRIVVKAVEVLSRLSKSARELNEERRLFVAPSISSETDTIEVQFGPGLIEFSKFVGVPPLEDGTQWQFTPHQFRRFFTLVYMWRYELANFSALSQQLIHFSEVVTARYALEIKDTEVLREARKSHGTSLISDIASGLREADGSAGVRIKSDLAMLTKRAFNNIEILSPRQNSLVILEITKRFVERTGLKMIPFLWGYCVSLDKLNTNGFKGKCVKSRDVAIGPDFVYATPETCLDCPHFYTDNKFRPHWETTAKAWNQHSESNKIVGELKKRAVRWAEVYNKGLEKFFNKPN